MGNFLPFEISEHDNQQAKRVKLGMQYGNFIAREYLARESVLYAVKWFDYRFLSPYEATEQFIADYCDIYKQKWRMYGDLKEAEFKIGVLRLPHKKLITLKVDETNVRREVTSLWSARQTADLLGIPYRFFISEAIDAHMDNGYRKVPRPNQLAAGRTQAQIITKIGERWDDWRESNFLFSENEEYRYEAYNNFHAQNEHRKWVLEKARHPLAMGRACRIHRILPERDAEARYGRERLSRALDEVATETPVPLAALGPHDLLPACFAVPFAFDASKAICADCPEGARCRHAEQAIRGILLRRCGCEDPSLARAREQNRERQRRRRERLRSPAGTASGRPARRRRSPEASIDIAASEAALARRAQKAIFTRFD